MTEAETNRNGWIGQPAWKSSVSIGGVKLGTPPAVSGGQPLVLHVSITEEDAKRLSDAGIEVEVECWRPGLQHPPFIPSTAKRPRGRPKKQ